MEEISSKPKTFSIQIFIISNKGQGRDWDATPNPTPFHSVVILNNVCDSNPPSPFFTIYLSIKKMIYIYNVNDENFSNILFWRSIFVSIKKKKKEDILQIYCIYIMTCCYFCVCCVYICTIMLQTWKKKNVGFFISYSHNIWDSILQFKLLK